jgi:hypothetical protein
MLLGSFRIIESFVVTVSLCEDRLFFVWYENI